MTDTADVAVVAARHESLATREPVPLPAPRDPVPSPHAPHEGSADDDLLAQVAHEMRNPLGAISAALAVLNVGGAGTGARERDIIKRQVDTLARLASDLLDATHIARDGLSLRREPVAVRDLLTDALDMAGPSCAARRHLLVVELPPAGWQLDADRTRVVQALSNVLSNAARYTPAGGRIEVTVTSAIGGCSVHVKDDGQGIAADDLRHLFDLYFRGGRDGGVTAGGLGVGLALVKNIVELHGGSVSASSEGSGRGSEFVVTLPWPAPCGVDAR